MSDNYTYADLIALIKNYRHKILEIYNTYNIYKKELDECKINREFYIKRIKELEQLLVDKDKLNENIILKLTKKLSILERISGKIKI